ncbi:HEAT repeat domain-containing protein [Endozoicomonas atrinae]|uniref:HEAT repeat domain-containing protein n=1 Tax=Endozoicomonas atrinae TaxID=1333660 RepID=UPI000824F6AF|nr:HEAT repeat domain-containing protein [Endozoicomonas atrinae]
MEWLIIWYTGLALATISLAMMVIEIMVRFYRHKIEVKQQYRRKTLSQWLSTYLFSPLETVDKKTLSLRQSDNWLLVEIADELFRSLKGGSAEKLTLVLEELGVYAYLSDFLDGNNAEKRMKAIQILYHSSRLSDAWLFQIMINYTEPERLRFLAMRVLLKKDACYVIPVIDTLEKNRNISWLLVADILRNTDSAGIEDLLKAAVHIRMPTAIRIGAMHALQELRAPIEIGYFHSMLQEKDERIRYHMLLIMKTVCPAIDNLILQEALADDSVRVRRMAAELSETQKQPELINALYTGLNDEDWLVTYHCACALYQLGDAGHRVLDLAVSREGRAGEIAKSVLLEQQKPVNIEG